MSYDFREHGLCRLPRPDAVAPCERCAPLRQRRFRKCRKKVAPHAAGPIVPKRSMELWGCKILILYTQGLCLQVRGACGRNANGQQSSSWRASASPTRCGCSTGWSPLAIVSKIGLGSIANVIHPYPTQAEAIRKAADAYNRTRLTPLVKRLFSHWLKWTC
jgi:hypothetical protein